MGWDGHFGRASCLFFFLCFSFVRCVAQRTQAPLHIGCAFNQSSAELVASRKVDEQDACYVRVRETMRASVRPEASTR